MQYDADSEQRRLNRTWLVIIARPGKSKSRWLEATVSLVRTSSSCCRRQSFLGIMLTLMKSWKEKDREDDSQMHDHDVVDEVRQRR